MLSQKRTSTSKKRNLRKIVLVLFSILVFLLCIYFLALGYLLYFPSVSEYLQRRSFDSSMWKDETLVYNVENPVRLRMIDDLLENASLVGISKNQLNEMLGTPDPNNYFKECEYLYWLGPERGVISIDSEWLCIKFSNDIVMEAIVVRD